MYLFSNDNLYRAKSKGALVREFVEDHHPEGELLEMFVNDLHQINLKVENDYFKALDYIKGEWDDECLEDFKKECEAVGVQYHTHPAKTFYYQHPTALIKVTLDENNVIDQIFMQGNNGLWKELRANQAKARIILNHAEEVANGESFGHYTRIFALD